MKEGRMARERRTWMRRGAVGSPGAGVLLLLALAAAPGEAQELDARWLPWLGCWEAAGEAAEDGLLCVRLAARGPGVEAVTLRDGLVVSTRGLRADGVPHEARDEGCSTTEAARFSEETGTRVFLRAHERCEGGVESVSTGILAMASPFEWIEVEAVQERDRSVAWVQRYRLASAERTAAAGLGDLTAGRAEAVRVARRRAAAPATVDEIIEATTRVDAEAVRAWVAEAADPFDLDSRELVRMADAGVPGEVIDVMVAVTWPERFAVDRQPPERGHRGYPDDGWHRPRGWLGWGWGWGYSPYYWDSFYSPWGFGWGRGYGGYYYGPSVIIVQPRGGDGGGRVIRGRGYTRGGSSSGDAGRARPPAVRRQGSGGGSQSSVAPAGGSRRSPSVSRSDGSRGSSSPSTGRTARPRGGGNGGGG